jgi:MFS family permease
VADTSLWFVKRRGIAVAVCMSGNYLAGAVWPPIAQHFVETVGWRQTYIGMGIFCGVTMALLALCFRARPPALAEVVPRPATEPAAAARHDAALRPEHGHGARPAVRGRRGLLRGDGDAAGAHRGLLRRPGLRRRRRARDAVADAGLRRREPAGVGRICDRIGGLRTLLLGGVLQCVALLLFLPFDGLVSLYVISALFGLFQGGIVPSYAIIVREHFPAAEAGARVGTVLMFTLFGMALGGWMSGKVFDLTGSYHAAFLNGIGWNLLNVQHRGCLPAVQDASASASRPSVCIACSLSASHAWP